MLSPKTNFTGFGQAAVSGCLTDRLLLGDEVGSANDRFVSDSSQADQSDSALISEMARHNRSKKAQRLCCAINCTLLICCEATSSPRPGPVADGLEPRLGKLFSLLGIH